MMGFYKNLPVRKTLIVFVVITFSFISVWGNIKDSIKAKNNAPEPLEFVFRPQLSLGMGMLTFYGDIGSNHKRLGSLL